MGRGRNTIFRVQLTFCRANNFSADLTQFSRSVQPDTNKTPLYSAGTIVARPRAKSIQSKLSKFAQVVVGARVSKSGNAMPQPGDLVGQAGPLKPPADKLGIVIDGVQQ